MVIIGGGFSGLCAAYELGKHGIHATVLERDNEIGGLAGSFHVNGARLEKFYHHWFTNDQAVMGLIKELGCEDQILLRPTRTGMYYANRFFKLSSPIDLLKFTPLSFVSRIRLGLLTLLARRVKDWRQLEDITASEWLRKLGGEEVYRIVWEPLLRGKFGEAAEDVSAVWMWNKLKLRGGSRGKGGREQLAYYRGGFAALADAIANAIRTHGGSVRTGCEVEQLVVADGKVTGVVASGEVIRADAVIGTAALPILAEQLAPHLPSDYIAKLRRIRYLANVCIVLELDRSLSSTYWLNVNDPNFPFVAVIEHTNFEPASTYNGRHIVYLSKYLPESDSLYQMPEVELLDFTLSNLSRMFPEFERSWILDSHVWRAKYSQPIVERHYSSMIPETETGIEGMYLASMAQVYPEDRGTNYAIREGRLIGQRVANAFK